MYPPNGAVLRNPYVLMSRETDPFIWVRVRNRTEWISAPGNGTMGLWVTLVEGENQLVVDFRDNANNTHVVVVDVVLKLKEDPERESFPPPVDRPCHDNRDSDHHSPPPQRHSLE